MKLEFDHHALVDKDVETTVGEFLNKINTLEEINGNSVIIHQDGVKNSYYIRCCIVGKDASKLVDLNARLNPDSPDSFRANRDLQLGNNTYLRMSQDSEAGREFNDIIVEYNTSYSPEKPLKVWGGQHRSTAIQHAYAKEVSRYHGFRVYFCLSKEQRSELALVSNTNINVSNDLFDRQLEETLIGPFLRQWCEDVGLLNPNEDFPDTGSKSERVTTQAARSFIVNFFQGEQQGKSLATEDLDHQVYEPYLCKSGVVLDDEYNKIVAKLGQKIWRHDGLKEAGKAFANLHQQQFDSIKGSKINRKSFRDKALTLSVLPAWAYVAGVLQSHPTRLKNHMTVPQPPKGVPDPLNAEVMSQYKHNQDPPTYRGLGTRSSTKERERMAQVFLARSLHPETVLDKKLLDQAVSQVVGLKVMSKGYAT